MKLSKIKRNLFIRLTKINIFLFFSHNIVLIYEMNTFLHVLFSY